MPWRTWRRSTCPKRSSSTSWRSSTARRKHPELDLGASPRAGIALVKASRARALIHGRDYVVPEDLYALAEDVLLHRIRASYEALAEGRDTGVILEEMLGELGRA